MSTSAGGSGALDVLHRRLDEHFHDLSARRNSDSSGTPVFALEHGLSEAELALLRCEVADAVRRGLLPRTAWLPLVVYAAEIGYEFCGDEYWQTFAARTPGWGDLGDPAHQYIRDRFREFRDRYSGAAPSGAWADHFSVISWPITHAVLPADLQRHLARLLFDFRRSLTAETLHNPQELGRRLAARTWQASSRFRTFAQNTRLLGLVAAALLAGEEDDSPYLLHSTLTRIVDDLSKERQSQRWLEGAKFTARHVRSRGFRPPGASRRTAEGGRWEKVASTDPNLLLRRDADGWSLFVELPDLATLSERLPVMSEELARLRPRINGVTRRFASGHLLYPGQLVRAGTWPRRDHPLIQLENGSDVVNALLADQCIMSPGPRWLFRLRAPALATEVRGKFVRPGHEYLLVSEAQCDSDLPPWASGTRSATEGINAHVLSTPDRFDDDDVTAIAQLGLGAVMDVEIRPVGFTPASWDGEGAAEWIEGEDPLVAIRSSRSVAQCIFTLDDVPALIAWPQASHEVIVRLTDLESGTHRLHVALLPSEADAPITEGSLDIVVRSPHMRPASGTPREGLMILASPASPTLGDLWDGQAFLEILGPVNARANLTLSLTDRSGRSLIKRSFTAGLRVDQTRWLELFATHFRRHDEVHRRYEEAEACVVTATAPGLGQASIRCERAFTALRWAFGRDRDGPYVTLVDNTDGTNVVITGYGFSRPTDGRTVTLAAGERLGWPEGGLVSAISGAVRAAVILPPRVRTLDDLRASPPGLQRLTKSQVGVLGAIQLADLWATAALPADPFAVGRRRDVLRAFARALASGIAGRWWAAAETAHARMDSPNLSMLREAIGVSPYQRRLANALRTALPALQALDLSRRMARFAALLWEHAQPSGIAEGNATIAEFLLRLATEPGTILQWHEHDVGDMLALTFSSPVLLRAARFVVLGTEMADDNSGAVYPGWAWQ